MQCTRTKRTQAPFEQKCKFGLALSPVNCDPGSHNIGTTGGYRLELIATSLVNGAFVLEDVHIISLKFAEFF